MKHERHPIKWNTTVKQNIEGMLKKERAMIELEKEELERVLQRLIHWGLDCQPIMERLVGGFFEAYFERRSHDLRSRGLMRHLSVGCIEEKTGYTQVLRLLDCFC